MARKFTSSKNASQWRPTWAPAKPQQTAADNAAPGSDQHQQEAWGDYTDDPTPGEVTPHPPNPTTLQGTRNLKNPTTVKARRTSQIKPP